MEDYFESNEGLSVPIYVLKWLVTLFLNCYTGRFQLRKNHDL